MPVSDRLMQQIQGLYPWMNQEMLSAYQTSWGEFEDTSLALQEVRGTSSYQTVFAGNFDSTTGTVRMSESEYFASKAEFDATLMGVNLNPDHFEDEWVTALEGEVSPREMLTRMEAAYERIIQAAPEIRDFYSTNFGIEMTDSAILASAISPTIGDKILNRQISMAEIGGSAAQRGFDIGADFAGRLAQIEGFQEDQFFGQARELIPAMQTLAARHADPDDEFNLEDVSSAFLFDDPQTRRRIRRLQAQEASTFTGGATVDFKRTETGGVAGLSQT